MDVILSKSGNGRLIWSFKICSGKACGWWQHMRVHPPPLLISLTNLYSTTRCSRWLWQILRRCCQEWRLDQYRLFSFISCETQVSLTNCCVSMHKVVLWDWGRVEHRQRVENNYDFRIEVDVLVDRSLWRTKVVARPIEGDAELSPSLLIKVMSLSMNMTSIWVGMIACCLHRLSWVECQHLMWSSCAYRYLWLNWLVILTWGYCYWTPVQ